MVLSELDEEFSTISRYIRDYKGKPKRRRHYKDFHSALHAHIYNFIDNSIDKDDEENSERGEASLKQMTGRQE